MAQPFDIFKLAQDGEPLWIEAATERVNALRQRVPSDYMVLSQRTGKRILFTVQGGIKRD
jgi:hypothetical protein